MKLVWRWANQALRRHDIHPCRIHGQNWLIHHPDLATTQQSHYQALKKFAHMAGWRLKADRRQTSQRPSPGTPTGKTPHIQNRRRKWLPVLTLGACLQSFGAGAEPLQKTSLKAYSSNDLQHSIQSKFSSAKPLAYNASWQQRIFSTLTKHWRPQASDPPNLKQELEAMATYYSQFPSVQTLFTKLENHRWTLRFAPQQFSTDIVGSRVSLDAVSIRFDPFSAAQFRFNKACKDKVPYCIARPADVLLHELLHVHILLSDPEEFIAQGGMSSSLYPYAHERQTIQQEQDLYRTMTQIDQLPRPYRSEHVGKHRTVACSTCLQ